MTTRISLTLALCLVTGSLYAQHPPDAPEPHGRPPVAGPRPQDDGQAPPSMDQLMEEFQRIYREILAHMKDAQQLMADVSRPEAAQRAEIIKQRMEELQRLAQQAKQQAEQQSADASPEAQQARERALEAQREAEAALEKLRQAMERAEDSSGQAQQGVEEAIRQIQERQNALDEQFRQLDGKQQQTMEQIDQMLEVARRIQQMNGQQTQSSQQEPQDPKDKNQDMLKEEERQNQRPPPDDRPDERPTEDPKHQTDPNAWKVNLPEKELEALERTLSGQLKLDRFAVQTAEYLRKLAERVIPTDE